MDREAMVSALANETFDLLVIGGGATGCGVALDGASRGLRVAHVEKNDFAEGTSGRSTKLIHGGVRYLEKAVRHFDGAQFNLVREGLKERATLLHIAPHLVHPVSFITPLYRWSQVPYVWLGLKFYDLLAGKRRIGKSQILNPATVVDCFPQLDAKGLCAGVRYYDGQFSDARMIVALVQTAVRAGALCTNYVEVVGFEKKYGKIVSTTVRDNLTGEQWSVRAKCVVNAAGPFADIVRRLDNANALPLMTTSTGVHIVLDKRFASEHSGLLIPKTEDGRVLFSIPWEGHVLVGSTDAPSEVTDHPPVSEEEIDYLLRHLGCYLSPPPTREDVKSTWSGLRPLVKAPERGETQNLVREHQIVLGDSGLLTVVGGKWTGYRRMAEQTVDFAIRKFSLAPTGPCVTKKRVLNGSENLQADGAARLVQEEGMEPDVATHLHGAYGDRASGLSRLMDEGYSTRLVPGHPFVEAEILYGVRKETARRTMDILCRRTPLAFLDRKAATVAAPRVIELMAEELGWGAERRALEHATVQARLQYAL